jgi:predicted aspartyl protease
MGLTYVDATVRNGNGHQETLKFFVDSGATYSLLPESTWRNLGLVPDQSMEFFLADGSAVKRKISECEMELSGMKRHTPVILGEPGDDLPLLGVVTLENFGLVLDPFRRELRTMAARL